MTLDLHGLLGRAAEDLVPEPDAFADRLDGVARLVRRRRAVRRVQSGAGAVVGVVALGSAAVLLVPDIGPDLAGQPAACGEFVGDALPDTRELMGSATVLASDGMTVSVHSELENLGDVDVTTIGDVQLWVSLPGTGAVVGHAEAGPAEQTTVTVGATGVVLTDATLVSCGVGGAVAGDPLPDGTYDLTLTGTASRPDGSETGWTASTMGITVEDGQIDDDLGRGPEDVALVCGEMIPVAPENVFWATMTPVAGPGPYSAADPAHPEQGGVTFDVTVGTTSDEQISAAMASETVTVLTDLGGTVVSWWRASDWMSGEAEPVPLELAPGGTQTVAGGAWFPVLDSCGGDAPIADGAYRLFGWVTIEVDGAVAPVLTAPLEITVAGGSLTVG
jgi:hypothetical protein